MRMTHPDWDGKRISQPPIQGSCHQRPSVQSHRPQEGPDLCFACAPAFFVQAGGDTESWPWSQATDHPSPGSHIPAWVRQTDRPRPGRDPSGRDPPPSRRICVKVAVRRTYAAKLTGVRCVYRSVLSPPPAWSSTATRSDRIQKMCRPAYRPRADPIRRARPQARGPHCHAHAMSSLALRQHASAPGGGNTGPSNATDVV